MVEGTKEREGKGKGEEMKGVGLKLEGKVRKKEGRRKEEGRKEGSVDRPVHGDGVGGAFDGDRCVVRHHPRTGVRQCWRGKGRKGKERNRYIIYMCVCVSRLPCGVWDGGW